MKKIEINDENDILIHILDKRPSSRCAVDKH